MARWTSGSLLRKLKALLQSEDLVIRLQTLQPDNSAVITWGSNEPTIVKVDPAQSGIITCVIHELLHVVLIKDLTAFNDGDLEEPIIEAIERELYGSLTQRQHTWWRKAIKEKVARAAETEG